MATSPASRQPELSRPESRASPIRPPPRIAILRSLMGRVCRRSGGRHQRPALRKRHLGDLRRPPFGPREIPPRPYSRALGLEGVGVGTDPLRLLRFEAAVGDTSGDAFLVLAVPGDSVLAPEVELVVERVDPDLRAAIRLLEVDVPALELPLVAVPEDPDRVAVAGPPQHQRAVPFPVVAMRPWVDAVRPWPAGHGTERRSLGQVRDEQPGLVGAHDARDGE